MTTAKLSGYGTPTTLGSTALNSLADGSLAATTSYDNSTNLFPLCSLELHVGVQTARSAGAKVLVYMSHDAVGSSMQDNLVESQIVAVFPLDAAVTARTHTVHNIPLPPSAAIIFTVGNNTGQAFAATLNTLKIVPYTMTIA